MSKQQRRIKFRTWVPSHNRMVYFPGPMIDLDTPNLMQFTGLLDKNGKEIYEGDIIKTGRHKDLTVVRYDDFGVPCLVSDKYMKSWDFAMLGAEGVFKNCEILGNLYENPELVKEPQ